MGSRLHIGRPAVHWGRAGVVRPLYDDILGDQLEQYTGDRAGKLEVWLGDWARVIAPRLHLVLTQVLQQIATTLESFNAVLGLEALNEPWQYTPLDVLKAFLLGCLLGCPRGCAELALCDPGVSFN